MNYRHAYHAGNFADVLKHVALVAALGHLARKDSPYCYLDTHAGRGLYPLDAPETQRAGEYRDGVLRLLDAETPPPAVARWLDLVRELGVEDGRLRASPGSPRFAAACLRPDDRAVLCELEAREADALRAEFRGDARVGVHARDGYEALLALVPPREKRGLVLVDPPYEQTDEFDRLIVSVAGAVKRWPTGVYAIWYPIKHGGASDRFLIRMRATGIRRQLVAELTVKPDDSPLGLNGAGLLFVNPPWQLDAELRSALAWLQPRLAAATARTGGAGANAAATGAAPRGRWRVEWLVPE
ncbi:MAG: 23S rRNA (adenine(2030)-N(6))-methyltransferase RlmJ [Pseudomonadota bacterium]